MDMELQKRLAEELHRSIRSGTVIDPLSGSHHELAIGDAYSIQRQLIGHLLADGNRIVGRKIGITSQAVMTMLGVDQPDFGCLLDGMLYGDGQAIPAAGLIQPKAEGEIAFLLKHDLCGPGITATDVLAATEGVMPSIEIVDSRIRDWKIFIVDTVADNASCGVFVLGGQLVDPRTVDLGTCGMVLEKNGEIAVTGAGAAALGTPVNAVVWLANTLGEHGEALKAGQIVLSGALGAMVPVKAGDSLRVRIGGIGACSTVLI